MPPRSHGLNEVVEDVAGQWGAIDFLLNDAGASNAKGILEIKEEEFDRTIAVISRAASTTSMPRRRSSEQGRAGASPACRRSTR